MGSELLRRKLELEKELSDINRKLYNCTHEWGEPVYDPQPEFIPYGFEYEGSGESARYRESAKMIPYWRQTCKTCGERRYTKKTVPVEVKPVF